MDLKQIKTNYGSLGVTGYSSGSGRKAPFTDDTQMTLWTAEGLIRAAIAEYSVVATGDFREYVLLAVNTVATPIRLHRSRAQILGTMGGVEVIPKGWLEGIGLRHVVERVAMGLYDVFYEDVVLPAEDYPAW